MSEIFFTADIHFGHKNIITFDATRPYRQFDSIEEHDEEIIKRWNATVKKGDRVWVLGDFAFGRHSLELAGRLNGLKRLVMGNHDTYPSELYLKHFHKLYGAVAFQGMLLTHIPVAPMHFARHDDALNVHGHLHNRSMRDKKYICVSLEWNGLKPIHMSDLMRVQADQINLDQPLFPAPAQSPV